MWIPVKIALYTIYKNCVTLFCFPVISIEKWDVWHNPSYFTLFFYKWGKHMWRFNSSSIKRRHVYIKRETSFKRNSWSLHESKYKTNIPPDKFFSKLFYKFLKWKLKEFRKTRVVSFIKKKHGWKVVTSCELFDILTKWAANFLTLVTSITISFYYHHLLVLLTEANQQQV